MHANQCFNFWVFKINAGLPLCNNREELVILIYFLRMQLMVFAKKLSLCWGHLLVCIWDLKWDLGTWSSYLLFLQISGLASFSFSFGEALFSSLKVVFVPGIGVRRFIVFYWFVGGVVCIFVPLSWFICCNWFAMKSSKLWFVSTTLLLVKWFVDCSVKGCLRERRHGTIKQSDLNPE